MKNVKPDGLLLDSGDKVKPKTPVYKQEKRKPGTKMSDKDFQSLVFVRATDAHNYVESEVAPLRKTATEYYKGRLPDVDKETTEEDRSTAVLTEVRDTVLGIMPDIMRTFFSAESVVRYDPVAVSDPQQFEKNKQDAKLATDYVQHVVLAQDNPDFFMTAYDAFQDAFVRKTGFIRWWWHKSKKPIYSRHKGLTEHDIVALLSDDGEKYEIVEKTTHANDDSPMGEPVIYDVLLRRYCEYGKAKISAVPCENIIVSSGSHSVDRCVTFGYIDPDKTVSDFIDMGIIDNVDELEGCDEAPIDEHGETSAREPQGNSTKSDSGETEDKTQRKVQYGELYITADYDGDGIAELRRVITAGTGYMVLENEPWDDVDFAAFCPYPEAHTFFGDCISDLTMDVQRIKSRVLRDVLDSLAQSVQPMMGVVEGQVNLDDALNPDTSKVVRMRAPNMLQPIVIPFVGKEGLPVLDLMTNTREARTGLSDASQGLDPKALQSTDNDAVMATLTKADARIELIARVFAEVGMTRLFRGLLKLIHKNQVKERMVLLNGAPVSIDPKSWNIDMHVMPNIPLGRGGQQQQVMVLTGVLAKQEQVLEKLGPQNPLVTLDQYYYTIARMLEVSGIRNAESYFTDPSKMPPEVRQKLEQAMLSAMAQAAGGGQSSGPAAPDPAIEQAKIASNEKIKMAELQLKQAELQQEFQIESAKIKAMFELEAMKLLSSRETTLTVAQLNAHIKAAGDRLSAETKLAIAHMKPAKGTTTDAGH